MDQTLKDKLADFSRALMLLDEVLAKDIANDVFMRAAAVQHFEMCFELCWKTAREFMSEQFGDDLVSPKESFRALQKHNLLTAEETEAALNMVEDRNRTAHTYDEEFIQQLATRLLGYYTTMKNVANKIVEKN